MTKQNGFSLIELIIVVAVAAILMAIAMPNYQVYTLRAHRSDAISALLQMQLLQERYHATHDTYATTIAQLNALNAGIVLTSEYYQPFTISNASTTSYTLNATATGNQMKDHENNTSCRSLTLDQTGNKLPLVCWKN